MKKLLLLTFVTAGINAMAQTLYPGNIPGCIARWDFANSGSAVNSLTDVSGNNHHSISVNALNAAVGFRNVPNKAIAFNGTNSQAIVANAAALQPTQMTLVSMVKFNGFYSGLCQTSHIVSKGHDKASGHYNLSTCDNWYDNSCYTSSPNYSQFVPEFGNVATVLSPGNYVGTGQWYFFAATYDGTTQKFYQVIMDPNNYVGGVTPMTTLNAPGAIGQNSQDVYIGRHSDNAYPYWFNGSMDEVALFNRALTNAEIQKVYDFLWGVVQIEGFNEDAMCINKNFPVSYTVYNSSYFQPGNVFSIELSDALGSFASPVIIGTTTATTSGTITCKIPPATPAGTGYRIRLVASNTPFTTDNNGTNIQVSSFFAPSVTIAASKSGLIKPSDTVVFTASPKFGGSGVQFQWKKNNVNVPGATQAIWVTTNLANNDVISVEMASSLMCVDPSTATSNALVMNVDTRIGTIAETTGVRIYPNPGNGNFSIEAELPNGPVGLQVTDAVGKIVHTGVHVNSTGTLNIPVNIAWVADGVYFVKLKGDNFSKTARVVVQH